MIEGDEDTPADDTYRNTARLRVAVGPLLAPVVARVVSVVAAHVDCPTDRLDDALLICDVIAAHAPDHVLHNHLSLTVNASNESLELRVEELEPDGARGLISASELPGVGNVLERIASAVRVEPGEGSETLLIDVGFAPATQ